MSALIACCLALHGNPPPRTVPLLVQVPIRLIVHPLDECIWLDYCQVTQ